jgi:hypothetical protein
MTRMLTAFSFDMPAVADFNLLCSGEKWTTYAGVNTLVSPKGFLFF